MSVTLDTSHSLIPPFVYIPHGESYVHSQFPSEFFNKQSETALFNNSFGLRGFGGGGGGDLGGGLGGVTYGGGAVYGGGGEGGGGEGGGLGGVSHVSPDQFSTHTQNQCVPLYCNLSPPGGMHFGGSKCLPFTTRSPTTCSSFELIITFPPAFCTPTVPFENRATGQLFANAKSKNKDAQQQQRNAREREIAGRRSRTRVIFAAVVVIQNSNNKGDLSLLIRL